MTTQTPEPTDSPQKIDKSDIPDYDSTGVHLYVSSRITINAPAAQTFRALTDPLSYHKWNTFIPTAEFASRAPVDTASPPPSLSTIRAGDVLTLQARMHPTDKNLHATRVRAKHVNEPDGGPYVIRWDADDRARFVLWAERWLQVVPLPDGPDGRLRCEFRSWENMGGVLAYVVAGLYGAALQERFFDWARDLKGFVEAGGGGTSEVEAKV